MPRGNDGDLVQRIGPRRHGRHQRVPRLVVGRVLLFLFGEDHGLALDAHQHFVFGHLEVGHGHNFAILPRRPQRRLVHQVGQIGARKPRRAPRDHGEIHVIGDGHLARVHAQDLFAPLDVRPRHHHAPVETARAQQRRVEHVRAVGRGDQDDAFVRFEAVHLHQQGV